MSNTIKKKSALKARGIRFTDELWTRIEKDAKKHVATPSDVVRSIVDNHYHTKPKK